MIIDKQTSLEVTYSYKKLKDKSSLLRLGMIIIVIRINC